MLNFKILILAIFTLNVLAVKDDTSLKAGLVFAENKFNTLDDDKPGGGETDEKGSYGVQTNINHRWDTLQLGIDSRITLGKAASLNFIIDNVFISGSGNIRSVDITPYIQFNSKAYKAPKKFETISLALGINPWLGYFKIGPSWMLQSIDLDDFNLSNANKKNFKLTYESFGLNIAFGIEEELPFADMHATFFEVSGSYYESRKVSLVDKSNSREINILSSREAKQEIKTFSLMFIVGMTLF